jgi:hypothetical protein
LDKIGFLRGISDYFWQQTAPDGSLVCPKHKVEHTGKNVYAALIDAKLHRLIGDEQYFERARRRVMRTVEKLGRDPEHGAWIFFPGRWAERNMANSVIDGGACADVLCTFYLQYRDALSAEESKQILDAVYKHADTYLRNASVEKAVTNRRLWGATGLAAAWRVFGEPSWREAVLTSITRSLNEQNADGSFFYYPHATEYSPYLAVHDLAPYYHSRHMAFAYYALEQISEPLESYADALRRGIEFLLAITHPNGVKEMRLETKRWYWESDYEVASNPFDYALLKAYEHTGEARFLHYATLAYRQLVRHQLKDGGMTSHIGVQHNVQCRVFWNGHVAWAARVIERVPDDLVPEETESSEGTCYWYFPDAGLVRMETTRSVAIV